jgi:hypothetical protein
MLGFPVRVRCRAAAPVRAHCANPKDSPASVQNKPVDRGLPGALAVPFDE